tara:strand:+ start:235 stop:732 length:498 start_codon:yes stop_codon:yes gene_type:complete
MTKYFVAVTALLVALQVVDAHAQVRDKVYKDWTVYTTNLDGKKICYMASFPKSKTGNYTKRDEPFFLVTNVDGQVYEPSTSSGYRYKKNSKVKVTIDKQTFYMSRLQGERAWADNEKIDLELIKSMKAKNFMNVKGTSIKGTYSEDRYSLSGFSAAYDRMNSLCK